MDNDYKKQLIKKHSPHSPILKNSILAFLFGGFICTLGELLKMLFLYLGLDKELSGTLVTASLILLAALLTALGIFDNVARYAGAGTLVPVTGFSNAVVSEAMDARGEGVVMGVGAKIFNVAGPVILYGIFSGVVYGLLYFLGKLIMSVWG